MFRYMFLPLNEHVDGGLGATGDAFLEAAKSLSETKTEKPNIFNVHLPLNFLYRHAIELYLKSIIVTLHRALRIPFGEQSPNSEPMILVNEKWQTIFRVHSVGTLFKYMVNLIIQNKETISSRARTDWSAVPSDLKEWIEIIEAADSSGTYFRYPSIKNPAEDAAKSSWKEESPGEIFSKMGPGEKYMKAFLLFDAEEELIGSYRYDDSLMTEEVSSVLRETAEMLSGAHAGIRAEIAGGY